MEKEKQKKPVLWKELFIKMASDALALSGWAFKKIFERLVQFALWVALGYTLIVFGIPLLGDSLAGIYEGLKEYFQAAPKGEKGWLTLFGIF